eukprot:776651-Rhodomonas_salina.6
MRAGSEKASGKKGDGNLDVVDELGPGEGAEEDGLEGEDEDGVDDAERELHQLRARDQHLEPEHAQQERGKRVRRA